jgi:cytoskeletal protein RodZ
MVGFTKKSIGTLTLGEKLRRLRSDRRITINEVSRVTKIQVKYLEYLEEGQYHRLPADVYVRGFLRSYADFLGVDENILLKFYDKEKGIKRNLEKDKKAPPKKIKPVNVSSFVFTPKKIVAAAVSVLVLTGLFFLWREIGSFASTPLLAVLSPENNSEVSGNFTVVSGVTDKDDSLFINGQPVLVGDDGKFQENLTLQSGVNVINIRAVNKYKKESGETVTVRSDYKENINPNQNQNNSGQNNSAQNSGEMQAELSVNPGPVWLSVQADGAPVFSGTMLSGAKETFTAKNNIVIDSGNGSATFVKLNGKDLGALSTAPDAVRGATITPDGKISVAAPASSTNANANVSAATVDTSQTSTTSTSTSSKKAKK